MYFPPVPDPSLRPPRLSEADIVSLGEGRAVLLDGVLSPEVLHQTADAMRALHETGVLTPALLGRRRSHAPKVRGDWTCWLSSADDAPSLWRLWSWWDELRGEIRQSARLPLSRFAVQLSRYPPGAQYVRHTDAISGDSGRLLTAVLYLNTDWQPAHGGALRVWEPEGPRDIEPIAGRLVMFLSERVSHAVLPTSAPRLAVTAWFRGGEAIPMLPDSPGLSGADRPAQEEVFRWKG